jgi:pantoate--beta-alanine ligase
MKIIRSISDMQAWSWRARKKGFSLGFVPTMGALHEGHLSLARRARRENDAVIVSIFVNPLQFGPREDFKKYPRPFAQDLELLKKARVDIVFSPSAAAMYPDGESTKVHVPAIGEILEGASRPGHFDGVATVVAKLFQITGPSRAYFGLKDYQQFRVIYRMVKDLQMPIYLVPCPTIRENDGLAYSSRNRYLSRPEREEAVKLYQALFLGRELVSEKMMTQAPKLIARLRQIFSRVRGAKVDYFAVVDPLTFTPMKNIRRPALLLGAVWIGKTRLIDNIVIS